MVGFALIGCGRIARRYVELLGREKIRQGKLVAVCDIKAEKACAVGEAAQVPWFEDLREMMAEVGQAVDVVCILTESGNHARHCLELAPYGKHIVVEKPMALTLDDADAMMAACDRAGVRLFVVKQNRYNLPVQKLREALDAGRFGRLVMGTVRVRWSRGQAYYDQDAWRGTWAMDGGVFTNQASHHVDLLEWMLGEPMSVFAKARTALVDIETEDTGVALIQFRNGALGVIEATTATRPKDLEGSLSIMGQKGTVEIGGFAVNKMRTWEFSEPRPEDEEIIEKYQQNPPNVYGFGHRAFMNHVVESLRSDTPALVDGLEGRKSLELISAIYESIETGREVHLRFQPKRCRLGARNGERGVESGPS
ncbi:MAG: Gfo/Idh/MocA family oxidoreductase [Gammaproteobacteria bacterium]|nr:Gfo/Idh/MocA family oxidoreductase [Gammaproteobacteria bacterium]MDJ0892494.1 Gfo/Idh/MocA family oxidoreductase [Gammaproteobacteria bacterium]